MQREHSQSGTSGVVLLQVLLWAIMIACGTMLASCGSSGAPAMHGNEMRTELRREQDCANKTWKAAHLGLWYNVCRTNDAE
ncbi:MAG TPA: hypothetical protein VMU87_02615 [Stellaceae bacterium]|nr:hypothetical protein [Stellaceae bacterium]